MVQQASDAVMGADIVCAFQFIAEVKVQSHTYLDFLVEITAVIARIVASEEGILVLYRHINIYPTPDNTLDIGRVHFRIRIFLTFFLNIYLHSVLHLFNNNKVD